MSIAGHPHKAILRGRETGCRVIQIFTRNRLRWSAKRLSPKEIESFHRIRFETSVIPIAIHGSYLINPASPHHDSRMKSLLLLLDELEWAEMLDIPFLVIHPGAHKGEGEKKGLEMIAETINRAHERTEGYQVKILLETTAGQGTSLGYRFAHLAEIMNLTKSRERMGVCFDTCHAFAAGYDFRTKEAYRQVINKFDKVIGIEKLELFHVNDSKNTPGSRLDRHDHPGKGHIGLKPFVFFLNDPMFADHPFVLETPKGTDENGVDRDIANLRLLESLIKGD